MSRLRKTKMVSFRVSSEEYEALKSLHRNLGHRSVSEFARSAVQRLIIQLASPEKSAEGLFLELSDRMSILDRHVADLHRLVEDQYRNRAIVR